MGFLMILESMSFTPADHGIDSKTTVMAIAVGSGAGGSSAIYSDGELISKAPGGASGCGGVGTTLKTNSSYAAGGGGGGGGFGAGGGGGACEGTGNYDYAGSGGGAGEVVIKPIIFSDPFETIEIIVGTRVPTDTAGETTSIGNLIVAEGGEINGGGDASTYREYGCGGGGGAGGFQPVIGYVESIAGIGGIGASGSYPLRDGTNGTGTAGGGGSGTGNDAYGIGGPYGGGTGGAGGNTLYSKGSPNGGDGYCYLGEAGSGVVFLWW